MALHAGNVSPASCAVASTGRVDAGERILNRASFRGSHAPKNEADRGCRASERSVYSGARSAEARCDEELERAGLRARSARAVAEEKHRVERREEHLCERAERDAADHPPHATEAPCPAGLVHRSADGEPEREDREVGAEPERLRREALAEVEASTQGGAHDGTDDPAERRAGDDAPDRAHAAAELSAEGAPRGEPDERARGT